VFEMLALGVTYAKVHCFKNAEHSETRPMVCCFVIQNSSMIDMKSEAVKGGE
jgi:hypothetical protein